MRVSNGWNRTFRGVRPWIERLARLGFAAKAGVYLMVAGLCLRAAVDGSTAAGPLDAIARIARTGLGKAFLLGAAPAFGAYALWRLSEAWFDPTGVGTGFVAFVTRVGTAVTGVIYAVLCVVTTRELLGLDDQAFGGPRLVMARVIQTGWGEALFLLVAGVMAGVAVVQFSNAWTGRFKETLYREKMPARVRRFVDGLGRVAFGVWGLIFLLLAWHTAQAALNRDVGRMQSVGGALRSLEESGGAWRPWPLVGVALGLAGFALYAAFEARWRKIKAA